MQGKKQYTEKLFTSFQLSDRVPENNFYRRLKSLLDIEFLREETKQYYGQEGNSSIDPIVFFKLILVGYFENLNSDRRIMAHASLRLDILYFIGYDIDEELPWHSTISRTRGLYGEEVFRKLFKAVLTLCVKKGMVGGKRQAIDSAFIKANASLDSVAEKEVIADGEKFLDELEENDENKVSAAKKAEVEYHHSWKQKTYKDQPGKARENKELDEFGNIIRPRYLSNHHITVQLIAMQELASNPETEAIQLYRPNKCGYAKPCNHKYYGRLQRQKRQFITSTSDKTNKRKFGGKRFIVARGTSRRRLQQWFDTGQFKRK